MTDTKIGTTPHPEAQADPGRVVTAVRTLFGPLWTTTFRDPVRQGRLRLEGLSVAERQLARAGLVTLVLLLVSMLFVDVWRDGTLLQLDSPTQARFVPEALFPVTLGAFFLALALIIWGALDAAPSVRVLVAVAYVGTAGALNVSSIGVDDTWIGQHGVTVVRICFAVPVAALLMSALLTRVTRRTRWLTPVLRLTCLVAFAIMLAGLLWLDIEDANAGFGRAVPRLLHSGFLIVDGLLNPLVVMAAIAVVDFAGDVSTSLSQPASRARDRFLTLVRAVLVGVIAVKLWLEVVDERDYWRAFLERQPASVARTVAVMALLVVACMVVNRLASPGPDHSVDEAKERLTLGGAVVFTLAYMVLVVLLGSAQVAFVLTESTWLSKVANDYPTDDVATWVALLASFVAVAGGGWLLLRARARHTTPHVVELATGMVVLGVWNAQEWVHHAADLSWGFSYRTVDVLVTLGVLMWAAVRWRRLDATRTSLLLALVLFSWLVMSRGDYISFLGALLGLPTVIVVVFGIAYTAASGAGFTSESSKRLPRSARTLMFTGYLLLSVTILHWLQAAHQPNQELDIVGFHYVAIPLAAWLVARRLIPRSQRASSEAPHVAEERVSHDAAP